MYMLVRERIRTPGIKKFYDYIRGAIGNNLKPHWHMVNETRLP